MAGCNVIPKHLEGVYLNWSYRISCHSLLYDMLDAFRNRLYMEQNNKEGSGGESQK